MFLSEEPWEGNSWRYNVVPQWWQLSKKPWCLMVDWEVYMLESAKGGGLYEQLECTGLYL